MPSVARPTAYAVVLRVARYLRQLRVATVPMLLEDNVLRDEGTARNALEALADYGFARRVRSKRPNKPTEYYWLPG